MTVPPTPQASAKGRSKRWSVPGAKEKARKRFGKMVKALWDSPEGRARFIELATARFTPEKQAVMIAASVAVNKGAKRSPETRAVMAEKARIRWSDPEARERHREKMREVCAARRAIGRVGR